MAITPSMRQLMQVQLMDPQRQKVALLSWKLHLYGTKQVKYMNNMLCQYPQGEFKDKVSRLIIERRSTWKYDDHDPRPQQIMWEKIMKKPYTPQMKLKMEKEVNEYQNQKKRRKRKQYWSSLYSAICNTFSFAHSQKEEGKNKKDEFSCRQEEENQQMLSVSQGPKVELQQNKDKQKNHHD